MPFGVEQPCMRQRHTRSSCSDNEGSWPRDMLPPLVLEMDSASRITYVMSYSDEIRKRTEFTVLLHKRIRAHLLTIRIENDEKDDKVCANVFIAGGDIRSRQP